jgi:hypothetical protein
MAFVVGKCVFQGNSGKKLSCYSSPKEAKKRMAQLHRIHKPKKSNRGKSAKKKNR